MQPSGEESPENANASIGDVPPSNRGSARSKPPKVRSYRDRYLVTRL